MAKRILRRLRLRRVAELLAAVLMLSTRDAAALGQSGGGGQGSGFGMFLPLILMFVVLYFFMIRPAQKRQKDKEAMLKALKKGDRVVTSGGIHGEILSVKEHTVIVRIAENVKVEMQRGSVSSVLEVGAVEAE